MRMVPGRKKIVALYINEQTKLQLITKNLTLLNS